MNLKADIPDEVEEVDLLVTQQANDLSAMLHEHRLEMFPPDARKTLRSFQLAEVAQYLGVTSGYLKNLSLEGKGPQPMVTPSGRRSYTAEQMLEMRHFLNRHSRTARYVPHRSGSEHLQVLAVVNFKGGSAKTTSAAHLAQHLALTGHRVLAIDLDPQASLSALYGFQPEIDHNESLYEALRYDDQRKPLSALVRQTNFPGLDVVPANLELQEYEYDTPLALSRNDGSMGRIFFGRLDEALADVADDYDVVVIDCPPQLGYLTLTALSSSTGILITVHPQMLDVMSMCQFLIMMGEVMGTLKRAGANMRLDWLRYLVTRYEPTDGPQSQMVAFMRAIFKQHVLVNEMLKSTAISDAGITKQTLYEVERSQFTRATYDRAMESLHRVNGEITELIHKAWRRR
ncbi:plasmid partitioning protein RepA [Aquamicrobium defluvii]|uniref:Chromosome partitioning protein ParA n=1 Tax=Aquamicrobium defluvii TaxID=69279 RepID=A0A011SUV4_9HYPH|nr:plasmid partitioning protein RepA [Aquamicrobium defluvii]EXL03009.1 chromosome partitioning protein ParA [Aquamicrobium defluvii]EZQ13432.1 chromosome partitioning protein ParA [Halopseudomonas bauzanensis]